MPKARAASTLRSEFVDEYRLRGGEPATLAEQREDAVVGLHDALACPDTTMSRSRARLGSRGRISVNVSPAQFVRPKTRHARPAQAAHQRRHRREFAVDQSRENARCRRRFLRRNRDDAGSAGATASRENRLRRRAPAGSPSSALLRKSSAAATSAMTRSIGCARVQSTNTPPRSKTTTDGLEGAVFGGHYEAFFQADFGVNLASKIN